MYANRIPHRNIMLKYFMKYSDSPIPISNAWCSKFQATSKTQRNSSINSQSISSEVMLATMDVASLHTTFVMSLEWMTVLNSSMSTVLPIILLTFCVLSCHLHKRIATVYLIIMTICKLAEWQWVRRWRHVLPSFSWHPLNKQQMSRQSL